MDIIETRPALLTIAMRVYCDGVSPKRFLEDLKNYAVEKLGGRVLYDHGGVVLEFPYQFVSIASRAYISAAILNSNRDRGSISLILSILDLMYPFSRLDYVAKSTKDAVTGFKNMLKQIGEDYAISVEIADIRFYDYPYRLQNIPYIRYY